MMKKLLKVLAIGLVLMLTFYVLYFECLNEIEKFNLTILLVLFDLFLIGQILGVKDDLL